MAKNGRTRGGEFLNASVPAAIKTAFYVDRRSIFVALPTRHWQTLTHLFQPVSRIGRLSGRTRENWGCRLQEGLVEISVAWSHSGRDHFGIGLPRQGSSFIHENL